MKIRQRSGVDERVGGEAVLISDADVRDNWTMKGCVQAVERAYELAGQGAVSVTTRQQVSVQGGPRLLTLSAGSAELGCMVSLAYSARPVGEDRRWSSLRCPEKVITVFDVGTGACIGVMGANYLLWQFTGATGAVAIKHLSDPAATSIAFVGSGMQARSALLGALEVRDISRVYVWSPHQVNAERFAVDFRDRVDVTVVATVREAVAPADLIVTVTTSGEPVLLGQDFVGYPHINAIGAHYPARREVDSSVVQRCSVFVDDRRQARTEKGDLLLAEKEGMFSFDDVEADLGEVVASGHPWRSPTRPTLFASCGSGVELLGATWGVLASLGGLSPSQFPFQGRP